MQNVRVVQPKERPNKGLSVGTRDALSQPREVDVMAICGVITTKEVLRHTATIVREFGPTGYMRCCFSAGGGRPSSIVCLRSEPPCLASFARWKSSRAGPAHLRPRLAIGL